MKNVKFISEELRLDGNHLCFDFVNTIYDRQAKEIKDLITSVEDWVAWLKKVELLAPDFELGKSFKIDLNQIAKVRALFYRIFKAIHLNEKVLQKDLQFFEGLLLKTQRATKLMVADGLPSHYIVLNSQNLNDYLLPITKAAYELFISDKIKRIKECSHCGWLYLDTSKNNSRKWCSMESCGSQVKAKKYYQKIKSKRAK